MARAGGRLFTLGLLNESPFEDEQVFGEDLHRTCTVMMLIKIITIDSIQLSPSACLAPGPVLATRETGMNRRQPPEEEG